ncbi:hypothetical protein CLAIMM_01389 [Cladophialophora immunda]|nr:hypothetical protein CLAIMM_01389 [Cladophialophora immunda]
MSIPPGLHDHWDVFAPEEGRAIRLHRTDTTRVATDHDRHVDIQTEVRWHAAPLVGQGGFPLRRIGYPFPPLRQHTPRRSTSNATVHFFRFIVHGDVLGRRVITKLLPLGSVVVAENDEHGLVPLVTQFTWFPEARSHGVVGISDVTDVGFAATTSFGDARVVTLAVPSIKDLYDERAHQPVQQLAPSSNEVVHKHELEAWTVAVIDFGATSADENRNSTSRVILSGGDDSALIASTVSPTAIAAYPSASTSASLSSCDAASLDVMPLWKDRRSHTAGVVAILPLSPVTVRNGNGVQNRKDIVPLVTGSYDEFIRLFEIDTKTYRAGFRTKLRLDGGVWRLKVLDQYSVPSQEGQGQKSQHHTLILASLMHAGAAIIRITRTTAVSGSSPGDSWTITPVTTFRGSHESMVYCCDARLDTGSANGSSQRSQIQEGGEQARGESPAKVAPEYTIVSTSFYDMKICTWKFADDFKIQHQ